MLHLTQARRRKQSVHGRHVRRLEAGVLHHLLGDVSNAATAKLLNCSYSLVKIRCSLTYAKTYIVILLQEQPI